MPPKFLLNNLPSLPELQQLTFSSYMNHNTYNAISLSGVIIFVSDLYPGSISDKEFTSQCGLLNLLENGDSVMADRGFEIKEDLG